MPCGSGERLSVETLEAIPMREESRRSAAPVRGRFRGACTYRYPAPRSAGKVCLPLSSSLPSLPKRSSLPARPKTMSSRLFATILLARTLPYTVSPPSEPARFSNRSRSRSDPAGPVFWRADAAMFTCTQRHSACRARCPAGTSSIVVRRPSRGAVVRLRAPRRRPRSTPVLRRRRHRRDRRPNSSAPRSATKG